MSEKKGKKKTKRSKHKYPSLKRNLNSKVRQEYVDYDYVDGFKNYSTGETTIRPLNDEEKQFLEDFNNEYYNASVGRQCDEGKDNRFHKSKKLVKERQDANNERQRDLYGRIRQKVGITKFLNFEDAKDYVETYLNKDKSNDDYEDALIDYLDNADDLENTTDNTDNDTENT